MTRYAAVALDLTTGDTHDAIEFVDGGWTEVRQKVGSWDATLNINDDRARRNILDPARTAVYFVDDESNILFGGLFWTPSGDGVELLKLDGQGVLAYYGNGSESGRIVEVDPGDDHVAFLTTDPMVIAEQLIVRSQFGTTGAPNDPLHLTVVRHGSCPPITRRYAAKDQKFIRDALEELAEGRFEFSLEYQWVGSSIHHVLHLWAGTRGIPLGTTIDLDADGVTLGSWSIDGFVYGNDVFAVGNGIQSRATASPFPSTYPLIQKSVSLSDIDAQTLLDHHTAYVLTHSSALPFVCEVTITNPEILSVNDFRVGDRLTVAGRIGNYIELEETFRIETAKVSLQPNAVNRITLTLAAGNPLGPPTLTPGQAEDVRIDRIDRGLRALERTLL